MGNFFLVQTPAGSWLIIAAFLGLLPTGIDVSLQASEWGKAKNVGMAKIRDQLEQTGAAARFDPFVSKKADLTVNTSVLPAHMLEYCRRWFAIGLWDFRLGHGVSFVIACGFLLLAAVWLYPSPVAGNQVMGEIAGMFTLSVGPWMTIVFLNRSVRGDLFDRFQLFRWLAPCRGGVLPEPVQIDRAATRHRADRSDTGAQAPVVLGIQHLPTDDGVLVGGVGGDHRGCGKSRLVGARRVSVGLFHRPGGVFLESLLLRFGDPKR